MTAEYGVESETIAVYRAIVPSQDYLLELVLLWNWVCPAVVWTVRPAAPNAAFEELSLGSRRLEGSYGSGVDLAVVVVRRLEPNEHVARTSVVTDPSNVAAFSDIRADERVQ